MSRGEKPLDIGHGPEPVEGLLRFLASLVLDRFYGAITIRFEAGKVTHVETETWRVWQYKDLPEQGTGGATLADGRCP